MKPEGKDQPTPEDIRTDLTVAQRTWTIATGKRAARTAAILDPSLDANSRQAETPGNFPQEVLGAARDLADYLEGSRVPQETNRHGIPHPRGWDLDHALQLIRDLAYALSEAGNEIPRDIHLRVAQELLELAVDLALLSRYEENKPFLDRLATGTLTGQE